MEDKSNEEIKNEEEIENKEKKEMEARESKPVDNADEEPEREEGLKASRKTELPEWARHKIGTYDFCFYTFFLRSFIPSLLSFLLPSRLPSRLSSLLRIVSVKCCKKMTIKNGVIFPQSNLI